MVCLINLKWVKKYQQGHRGAICLFFDTQQIDTLYQQMRHYGLSKPEKMVYKFFFGLASFSPKWKNSYFPFFDGVPMQLGFQQVDTPAFQEKMYQRMKPNSQKNGIHGIKMIEFLGPFTTKDFDFICSTFFAEKKEDSITLYLENEQTIRFSLAKSPLTKVYLASEIEENNRIKIENIEIYI